MSAHGVASGVCVVERLPSILHSGLESRHALEVAFTKPHASSEVTDKIRSQRLGAAAQPALGALKILQCLLDILIGFRIPIPDCRGLCIGLALHVGEHAA